MTPTWVPDEGAHSSGAGRSHGPDPCMADYIVDNARRYPDIVAFKLGDRSVTHAGLLERASAVTAALAARGLDRQDRFAVLGRNSVEYGELYATAFVSGLIMCTVNFRLAAAEFEHVLGLVAPKVLFCDREFLDLMLEIVPRVPSIELVVCLDGPGEGDAVGYEQFVAEHAGATLPFHAEPADVACLVFTSGTTGASKACILGQRELWQAAQTINDEIHTGSDDRGLINMPMFHFGAIQMCISTHARGGSVVLQRQFDPREAVALAAPEKITMLHLAPTMLQALLDVLENPQDLASVRVVVYAAAAMNTRTLRQALHAMPEAGFLNLYGQTEGILSGLPREFHSTDGSERSERRLTSIGFPYPGYDMRLLDEDGNEVALGEPGEIVVRSRAMFRGYWNDSAATMATLRDGWCHTGDIGVLDEEGLLYLVDRKKDVIITGGENVYSPEVESVLLELPEVRACAVVGRPDPDWGEAVCAVVVLAEGAALTLERVREHAHSRIARYKAPRYLVPVDALPLLANGKVDKKVLRAMVNGHDTAGDGS